MGTEARYLTGPGVKCLKTAGSIRSTRSGSLNSLGEITQSHTFVSDACSQSQASHLAPQHRCAREEAPVLPSCGNVAQFTEFSQLRTAWRHHWTKRDWAHSVLGNS